MNRHHITNLVRLYRASSRKQIAAGRLWYKKAHTWLEYMASTGIYPVENVVCAFAALSPRITWNKNCLALVELLVGGGTKLGYTHNIHKAKDLLWSDEPLVGLNTTGWAHKTENFARAILGDPHAVVLDTWMLRTMGVTIKDVKHRYQYDGIARRVRMAAALVGERTAEFQAIVWLKVRSE